MNQTKRKSNIIIELKRRQTAKTKTTKTTPKQAIHTGKNQKPKSHKSTLKKSKKFPKTPSNKIKTINNASKTAKKNIQRTKQTIKSTKKAAKNTARVVKAIAVKVKQAVDMLISAIAAGGWIVVVIIIVIAAIIFFVLASPFGILFNEENDDYPSVKQVIIDTNSELNDEILRIIDMNPDVDKIIFNTDNDSMYFSPPNWIDILAVYAVKNTTSNNNYLDVLIMGNEQINSLKATFWDMNKITSIYSEMENEDGEIETTLTIDIYSLSYIQGSSLYAFSEEQNTYLTELLSDEYYPLLMELCGIDSFVGLTTEDVTVLLNDLPNTTGGDIIRNAVSRIGHPYSQSLRGQGNYVDCSYLARWCYNQAGISSFTASTAAEQARYCVDNNMTVSIDNLQTGDLIFWSFSENGRYENITHVGIYAGNGYVIDASASRGMVVYRELFGESAIIVCGRAKHEIN